MMVVMGYTKNGLSIEFPELVDDGRPLPDGWYAKEAGPFYWQAVYMQRREIVFTVTADAIKRSKGTAMEAAKEQMRAMGILHDQSEGDRAMTFCERLRQMVPEIPEQFGPDDSGLWQDSTTMSFVCVIHGKIMGGMSFLQLESFTGDPKYIYARWLEQCGVNLDCIKTRRLFKLI